MQISKCELQMWYLTKRIIQARSASECVFGTLKVVDELSLILGQAKARPTLLFRIPHSALRISHSALSNGSY